MLSLRLSLRRPLGILPEEEPAPRVVYTPALVAFVAALGAASLGVFLATAGTSRGAGTMDASALAVGGLLVFAGAYCSVRMTAGVDSLWTAGVFVQLALSLVGGPVGALVAAVSQAAAVALRVRTGWFRMLFNASNFFLSDVTAWFCFHRVAGWGSGVVLGSVAGALAGAAECLVNHALLAGVICIASNRRTSFWDVMRRSVRSSILYSIGYGWAAYGAVLLYAVAGAVGFSTTLVPVILLQGFLVFLARRLKAQEKEREQHAAEREALLRQAIEASEAERKRIAGDLHDGVVQTLAGLAFSLAAKGSNRPEDAHLGEAAAILRSSVTDLRTLMIEIAPPDLEAKGVDEALRKLLEPLPARGIEVDLDSTPATHLPADKTSLVFRVAQEAIRNVVNHSQATKVTARLRHADGVVRLEVADNGRGFSQGDRSRRRDEGHVGLHLLNNAVVASNGTLSLESEPGAGTTLMLELPC